MALTIKKTINLNGTSMSDESTMLATYYGTINADGSSSVNESVAEKLSVEELAMEEKDFDNFRKAVQKLAGEVDG
ncbi:hypothetical protein [Companilactobacillus mishanensis]|uniref:Uncharacterized protein n=1 Tax=Companilactobacillus mishanensis TaxID=2486008 RepID=A0A5P0ZGN8_9LACO|nr:hypothetical protein [Companilactobacillus mishanensis]MQS52178.1 hypothetical protein [Companilactobacillus mishanensis]